MTLTFTGVGEGLNFCSHPVVKWHEVAQTFAVVDYVREMTKETACNYGEYGSVEHVLYLLSFDSRGEWAYLDVSFFPAVHLEKTRDRNKSFCNINCVSQKKSQIEFMNLFWR